MTEPSDNNEKKVDDDWKEQAAREREKPREESATARPPRGPLPKPTFSLLLSTMASQVYIFLGEIANPLTGKHEKDLDQAKYTIDMLEVLKEKTKGNVTEDERKMLDSLIFELRMRYVNSAGK